MAFGNATKGYVKAHSGGGGGSGTTDYSNLTNLPKINGVELLGNKEVGLLSGNIHVDYTKLTNQPSINGVALSGNKTSSDLGIDGVKHTSYVGTSSSTSTDVNTVTIPDDIEDAMYIIIGRGTNFLTVFIGKLSYDKGYLMYAGQQSGTQLVDTSYSNGELTITGSDYVISSNESGKTYDVYLI